MSCSILDNVPPGRYKWGKERLEELAVEITIVSPAGPGGLLTFSAAWGEGRGQWMGPPLPLPGERFDVEMEVPGLFIRWVNAVPAPGATSPSISIEGDGTTAVTGVLEELEEDGTAWLRLGDLELTFECLGEPMGIGGFITLRADRLQLYPKL